MKNRRFITITLALIIGVLLGRVLFGPSEDKKTSETTSTTQTDKKPVYWIDPMEPNVPYPGPGKSRMGMELVPVYKENPTEGDSNQVVRISPNVVNNLGIRTEAVLKGPLARKIETVGFVEPNENQISHVHTYAEGWIKKLVVKTVGQAVKKGELLFQLYSPTLVTAQEEFIIALESKNQMLIDASIKKLSALHLSSGQIQQVKDTRKANQLVDIEATQDGIIAALNVREGMRIAPEMEVMSLIDLSSIWMLAQIYEQQANWVFVGAPAAATLSAFPGKSWQGKVEYVYPEVDPTTRTLKVRFRFDNPENILKPNMYANITLEPSIKQDVLSVSREALIQSSKGTRVIVALGEGRFEVRGVVTGMESGEKMEILSGLSLGEKVVTSGQFLIDSEANLKATLQRIEGQDTQKKGEEKKVDDTHHH